MLAQLVVFKEEARGCTAVPRSWGKRMNKKFGVTEAPDWWSEELAAWANQQRTYGKAFKKPASQRSEAEKTYAKNTTERRVALLDGNFFCSFFFLIMKIVLMFCRFYRIEKTQFAFELHADISGSVGVVRRFGREARAPSAVGLARRR